MTRTPPQIQLLREDGYNDILYVGYDWWQECHNRIVPRELWDRLTEAKAKAVQADETRKSPVEFFLDETPFQLLAKGASGGTEFVLVNDDLRIEIGSPNRDWSVKWRATAAALAEYGLHPMIDQAHTIFDALGMKPRDPMEPFIKVTRVDVAFDFYSPKMTLDMTPALANCIVTPSENKTRADFFARGHNEVGAQLQTLTIGSKQGCQVQLYDKTAEITESSGKVWMLELWGREGYYPTEKPRDVWRLEVRMSGDWLKKRTGKAPESFFEQRWSMIADALYNRRLTRPTRDTNHRRWPLHPLWSSAVDYCGNPTEFPPIGHQVTMRASKLQEALLRNMAGTARSSVVLAMRGGFNEDEMENHFKTAMRMALEDVQHGKKIERAKDRYLFIDEAT